MFQYGFVNCLGTIAFKFIQKTTCNFIIVNIIPFRNIAHNHIKLKNILSLEQPLGDNHSFNSEN